MKKGLFILLFLNSCFAFSQTKGVIMNASGLAVIDNIPVASTLFSQLSTQTVTGTSETSLKGTMYGSDTIKPSDVYPGKTWLGYINGTYSTALVSVGNLVVKVYLGSTVILSSTIVNLPINISSLSYASHIQMVCRATGSSGSVAATGYVEFSAGTALTTLKLFFTPTVTSVDFSTNKVYNPTAQYSLTGNTLTTVTHTLISLN